MDLSVSLRSYDKSRRVQEDSVKIPLDKGSGCWELGGGVCIAELRTRKTDETIYGEAVFTFRRPTALASSVAVEATAGGWRQDNYVFMPGAVYNGNRFACQKLAYPPYAQIPEEQALTAPAVITDIPHLSAEGEPSGIELRSGDMTTLSLIHI